MNNKTWTVRLEEDAETGDIILPFPLDFSAQEDWHEGDTLDFQAKDDGSWVIENLSWHERQRKHHRG